MKTSIPTGLPVYDQMRNDRNGS